MSSNQPPLGKRLLTWGVVAIGAFLIVRLVWIAAAGWFPDPPRSLEESKAILRAGAEKERQDWEQNWIRSGAPPPPGGFDAAWKAARNPVAETMSDSLTNSEADQK